MTRGSRDPNDDDYEPYLSADKQVGRDVQVGPDLQMEEVKSGKSKSRMVLALLLNALYLTAFGVYLYFAMGVLIPREIDRLEHRVFGLERQIQEFMSFTSTLKDALERENKILERCLEELNRDNNEGVRKICSDLGVPGFE